MIRQNSFFKSTIVSWLATGIDYLFSIFFYYLIHFDYVLSTTLGAISGAIVSFYFGKSWAFNDATGRAHFQAFRFLLVLFMSIFLNAYGVFILGKYTELPFSFIRIIISAIVGLCFNYFMFRHFVFRR